MKLLKEFKEFALKGNVMDMAIGVIIGGAFSSIVTALTTCFINPLINSVGGAEVAGAIKLPWVDYTGLDSEAALALSINYGGFITAIINFLILAVILFIMLKAINGATKAAAEHSNILMNITKGVASIPANSAPACASVRPSGKPPEAKRTQ